MNRRKALTAALFSLSLMAPTAMMAQYPQLNADARKTYDVLINRTRPLRLGMGGCQTHR